jgi:hypothetical protein
VVVDLREVSWTDAFGRHWATLIPIDEPDSAARTGLPLGPVPLDGLNLPLPFEVALHNELFARRLFTFADASARDGRQRLQEAIAAAVKIGAHELYEHYRRESGGKP